MTENMKKKYQKMRKNTNTNITKNNLGQKIESVDVQSNESNENPNWKEFREARKKALYLTY